MTRTLPSPLIRSLLCALALGAPALAQDAGGPPAVPEAAETALPEMAELERAWARNDFVTVRQGLKLLAEETGTALAQYRYGRVLIEGRGGPRDPAGAVTWLDKAVAQDHAEAATLLARIYLSEVPGGPPRDATKAAELLSRAAPRGAAEAQYLLGLLYQSGEGVARDLEAARTWLLAASEQQNVQAQFALAALYLTGPEEIRNGTEGLRWLREAAGMGLVDAQLQLANLLNEPASGATDRTEALDWFRRAAEQGHPIAQRILGTRYLQGDGVAADPAEAFRWLTQAAEAGDAGAMGNLGYAHAAGLGTAQDMTQAARWYSAAADQGLGRAMVTLGQMLEAGAGVDPSFDTALAYYLRALETSDAGLARVELGRLAIEGKLDGRMAPQRAVPWVVAAAQAGRDGAQEWLTAQAEGGDARAQSALGRMLFDTAPERRAEALDLMRGAADLGDVMAQFALAEILARGDAGDGPDYVAAHGWYNVAATLGHPEAAARREVLDALMTPEQVADAQAAARAWFEKDALRTPGLGGN
ncbi:SEL1-like repeat protein [Maliponia aquimaris]|uniref:Localization factor PodJL n=1 Tax=Maliponia aquimaris TaxID=1673631 RepID=A0A238KDE9_9RHOB|nr:tetratricopeptide repeat protein [Maliponia aquimaris]SMX40813.1 Localization factor PodJL [Maliponia aquimaris]